MSPEASTRLRRYLTLLAPGTALRNGLERIVQGRTGALVVLGNPRSVQAICTGGFGLDVAFSATALRELAKMDGAIVLNADFDRIIAAGVHLMPAADIDTDETGTRHRTADRVAQQTSTPVVTVSSSMATISLFIDGERHVIERSEQILARASQALQTLVRYRERLLDTTARLTVLEVQDQVSVRDLVLVMQRLEMMRRLDEELTDDITRLGADGRLVSMQLSELTNGVDDLDEMLRRDYPFAASSRDELAAVDDDDLADVLAVARACGLGDQPDARLQAHGYRQLSSITRLPATLSRRLLDHFGGLQGLFGATPSELQQVEGVGEQRARIVREGLARLAESLYDERMR